ncbi:MAG TPA: hypothetical protein DD649_03375 [Providencia sp.]|uniref:hypothetical protein n=1 Tax=Providencia sp. TaxID=589 RepID=UPI000E9F3AC1|nr:hypothetical protein [Providencia sp.]HBO21915.1 hypothetical protein [Providencia sp.]
MRNKIESFLSEEYNSGLMIVGDWGIGKTFYTLNLLKTINHGHRFDSQSYVSLLGMNKIEDVERNIHDNIRYFNKDGVTNLIKDTLKIDKKLKFRNASFDITNFVPNRLNKTIIILDDLERKGETLKTIDLIALAHRITQNFSCKFIIISNLDKIHDEISNELITFDKIFSNIIRYSPTDGEINKAIHQLFTLNTKNYDVKKLQIAFDEFKSIIKDCKIKNIRILYKMFIFYYHYIDFKPNGEPNQFDGLFVFLSYLKSIGVINTSLYTLSENESKIEKSLTTDSIDNMLANKFKQSRINLKSLKTISICLELLNEIFEKTYVNYHSLKVKLDDLFKENDTLNKNDHADKIVGKIVNTINPLTKDEIEHISNIQNYNVDIYTLLNLITIYGEDEKFTQFFNVTIKGIIHNICENYKQCIESNGDETSRIKNMETHIKLLKEKINKHSILNYFYDELNELEFKTQENIPNPNKTQDDLFKLKKIITYLIKPYVSSQFFFFPNKGPFLLRVSDYETIDSNYFRKNNTLIQSIDINDIIKLLFEEVGNFELVKSFYKFIYMTEFNINDILDKDQSTEDFEVENPKYSECLEQFKNDIEQTVKIIKGKLNQIFTTDPTLESRIKIHIA